MPELPDVEVFRQHAEQHALKQRVSAVEMLDEGMLGGSADAKQVESALKGNPFESTHRHGKNLFLGIGKSKGWLWLHFGMTGHLHYAAGDEEAPAYSKLVVRFTNGAYFSFINKRRLGRFGLVPAIDDFIRQHDLGEDALSVDPKVAQEGLKGRTTAIKSALMDQTLLAGIGNVYADEILFHAGIRPETKANALDDKQFRELFRQLKKVMEKTIACGADPARVPSSYLLPHRNKNERCPRCDVPLRTMKVSGRTTYYCPEHQK